MAGWCAEELAAGSTACVTGRFAAGFCAVAAREKVVKKQRNFPPKKRKRGRM